MFKKKFYIWDLIKKYIEKKNKIKKIHLVIKK